MTPFKLLVISGAMALMAWSPGQAATDADGTAEVTGTPSASSSTATTHHRKHHTTTGSGATNGTTATASGEGTTSKSAKSARTGKTGAASDKSETTGGHTSTTGKTASGSGKAGSTSTGGKTSEETSSSTSTTGKSHTLKKHHTTGTETAAKKKTAPEDESKPEEGERTARASTTKTSSTKTSTTPAEENSASAGKSTAATSAASGGGAAAAAATVVNSQTAVATPGRGRHHRHGKTTETAVVPPAKPPEPPIVITTVNVPPLSSANAAPPLGLPAVSNGVVPTVVTSLPVPRPGSGTTASLALVRNPGPPVNTHFTFSDMPARTHVYPWKRRIVTTVFWIGEGSTPMSSMTNKSSAWDINWVHDNGGADDQYDMSGYGSGSHASLINPFYVALPFNDLAYPDKTQRWLPSGWYKPAHHGEKQQSSCQGRWIEIKNAAGRSCFAQWEDVGPVVTDDAEYVFGSAPPSASRGLDVSPAVSKYLGFDSTAYTSWRFVDDDDVPPGLWLRYNEQAILFQALKDQARRGTPIQALSQPVPDGVDDSHSEKEIRSGRG